MEKLNNWNDWFNDKIVLHSSDETAKKLIINLNTIKHLEEGDAEIGGACVWCTEGDCFCVKETVEEIAAIIGDLVKESEARREAEAAAQMERYKAMQESAAKGA